MIVYRNTKVNVHSPVGDTDYFDIVAGVQGDTLAPYILIICLDNILRTSIDTIKENGFQLTKKRRRLPHKNNYRRRLHWWHSTSGKCTCPSQKPCCIVWNESVQAYASMSMHTKRNTCALTGDISTLGGSSLKLVDRFTYLGSSVSSTKKDIDSRSKKALKAIDRLSFIWKSDMTDKIKRSFFQVAVVSILPYGCTTWTLTKQLEKKLDGNYSRMLRAILNNSKRQQPTKQQLYGHLPPITKTIIIRRTWHCWRRGDELISDIFNGPPYMAELKLEPTYSSSVRMRYIALRICQKRWTIGRSGDRGSGISVLVARHDDDEHKRNKY